MPGQIQELGASSGSDSSPNSCAIFCCFPQDVRKELEAGLQVGQPGLGLLPIRDAGVAGSNSTFSAMIPSLNVEVFIL